MNISFFKNTKDNSHCFQACLKMVLKFYFPKINFSYKKLDKISDHKSGMWTWQGKSLLYLNNLGFKIINIENLDYKKFSLSGEKYLKNIWPEKVFNLQKKYSNLKEEQKIAEKLIRNKAIKLINKKVLFSDLEKYFRNGYLVIVSVNPCVFNNKKCYWSHAVLITDVDSKLVTFHDPGLPPVKNRKITKKKFIKAMSEPWKKDNNLIALKYTKNL